MGIGGQSAQGARRARRDAEAVGADHAEEDPRPDSAAAARLRASTASCFRAPPATASIRSSPATIAADVTIGFVLQPDRAARMVAQHAVDPALPGLEEVIDRLAKATFDAPTADAVRSRSAARRGARAGRSRDVAGGRRRRTARCVRSRRCKLQRLAARLRARRAKPTPTSRSTRCSPPTSSASSSARPKRRRCCPPRRRRQARRSATGARIGCRGRPPARGTRAIRDSGSSTSRRSRLELGTALPPSPMFPRVMLVPNWHHHDHPPSPLPHRLF